MEEKVITPLIVFERYAGKVFILVMEAIFVILFFRFFILSPGIVNGPSMEPGYVDEDLFLVNRFVYLFSSPKRGDVVNLVDLKGKKLIIKRVVGLPGDIVVIKRGRVYIQKSVNEEEMEMVEPYLSPNTYTIVPDSEGVRRILVGDKEYFVMGDNREHSVDSRVYGPIFRSRIVGKVFWISKKG